MSGLIFCFTFFVNKSKSLGQRCEIWLKKAPFVKNDKKLEKAMRFLSIRRKLRKASINMKLSDQERSDAFLKLQKLSKIHLSV